MSFAWSRHRPRDRSPGPGTRPGLLVLAASVGGLFHSSSSADASTAPSSALLTTKSPPATQRSPTAPPNPPKSVTCRGFVIAPRHVTEVPAADIPTARFRHYPERLLAGHRVILLGDRLTTDQFAVVRNRQRPTHQITLRLVAN